MPVTALDPITALIVVDLQTGTVRNPMIHDLGDVTANAAALLESFRSRDLPVVIATANGTPAGVNSYGGGGSTWPQEMTVLVPEIQPLPGEITVTRAAWNTLTPELHEQLTALGVTQVVLVGLATSFGIESTARAAYDLGYSVVVVTDAISDMRAEAHENSVTRVFPILGQTATTAELLAL